MRALFATALFLLALASLAGFVASNWLEPVDPQGAVRVFTVTRGSTLGQIAHELETQGLVRSAWATEWQGRYDNRAQHLRAGEYEVSPAATPREILERLAEGPVKTYPVALPEGLRLEQIADRLDAAGLVSAPEFIEVVRDPAFAASLGLPGDSMEGFLFPETYRIPRGLPPTEVARVLAREFLRTWKSVEPAALEQGLSMRDVVILASIVEKETAAPEERPRIASVFHNRLEQGIPLATDPTVIYGIEDFDGNLTRAHLLDAKNPYNTYRHEGLPPGPISNPGAAALRAVVDPEQNSYLFFVSRNDGTHVFSRTYAEHEKAVDRYQRKGQSR